MGAIQTKEEIAIKQPELSATIPNKQLYVRTAAQGKITSRGFENFTDVHGGIFKKLQSLWTKFLSTIGFVEKARANGDDYADLITSLETKYGKDCIPASLYKKRDKALKSGRSAMVTHGTLERAEKLCKELWKVVQKNGYKHHPKTDESPAYWSRSFLDVVGGKSQAISCINRFYGNPEANSHKLTLAKASDEGVTVFYKKIDTIENGGWKSECVKLDPPAVFKWDEVEVRPRINGQGKVAYDSAIKFIEFTKSTSGEIKFEYIPGLEEICGNNPMLNF